jgi:hypothetical protein
MEREILVKASESRRALENLVGPAQLAILFLSER